MNWVLIVLVAGNFTFAKVMDTEAACEKVGTMFTVNDGAEFVCVSSTAFVEMVEGL